MILDSRILGWDIRPRYSGELVRLGAVCARDIRKEIFRRTYRDKPVSLYRLLFENVCPYGRKE